MRLLARVFICSLAALPASAADTASVNAPADSPKRVRLDWRDNSVNETRFEIQRSTAGGPFAQAGTAPANAQSFIDSGLRRSTTYTYRVRACNAGLCSPFSNLATVATP